MESKNPPNVSRHLSSQPVACPWTSKAPFSTTIGLKNFHGVASTSTTNIPSTLANNLSSLPTNNDIDDVRKVLSFSAISFIKCQFDGNEYFDDILIVNCQNYIVCFLLFASLNVDACLISTNIAYIFLESTKFEITNLCI